MENKPCFKSDCPEYSIDILHFLESHFYINKEIKEKVIKLLKQKLKDGKS